MNAPSWVIESRSPLERRPFDGDERLSDVVLDAFEATEADVFEREQALNDQIDTDALDGLDWGADPGLALSFTAWDHRVEITGESVTVYECVGPPDGVVEHG